MALLTLEEVAACMRRLRLHLLVPIVVVFLFDWCHVVPYGEVSVTYYDEQADAFLAGRFDLLRPPPDGLLALPDPWDPVTNRPFHRPQEKLPGQRFIGVHDLSLYKGRFYLQWGPFPALVLIPLRWIAGGDLPMGYFVLIIETVAALAYAAATLILARLARLPTTRTMECLILTAFLVNPLWQSTLHRVAVYETGVFFAQLCLGLAFLCVTLAFDRRLATGSDNPALLAAGSACLGLMVNCRPNLAPLGLMVPLLLWAWARAGRMPPAWRPMIGSSLALGAPAAILLTAYLLYNQARFGNPFETGQSWQLWTGQESIRLSNFIFLQPARILPNIWYYFMAPVEFGQQYSLLIGAPRLSPQNWLPPELAALYGPYINRTAGLFIVAPMAALALGVPFLLLRKLADRSRPALLLLLAAALLSGLLLLAPAVMRYAAEWAPWWLAAGALMALRVSADLRAGNRRRPAPLFDATLVLTTAWSCWVGAALLCSPSN